MFSFPHDTKSGSFYPVELTVKDEMCFWFQGFGYMDGFDPS